MAKVPITIATWDYDRVRPIMDGRVTVEGCEVNFIVVPPEECFHRAWNNQDFDVTEIGLSGYIIATSRGDGSQIGGQSPYVGIPVFLSRSFRCSGIYIRTDRGIERPEDLRGKRVGIPEYQITAAVWSRGFLADEYGIAAEDLRWFQGGMDDPGRKDKWPNNLPDGFPLTHLSGDQTINAMLKAGELDAFIGPRTPIVIPRRQNTQVRRLFEDFETVEKAIIANRNLPDHAPVGAAPRAVRQASMDGTQHLSRLRKAKQISQREMFETAALKIGHPWIVSSAQSAQDVMGPDIFPYGVEASMPTLEAAIRLFDRAVYGGPPSDRGGIVSPQYAGCPQDLSSAARWVSPHEAADPVLSPSRRFHRIGFHRQANGREITCQHQQFGDRPVTERCHRRIEYWLRRRTIRTERCHKIRNNPQAWVAGGCRPTRADCLHYIIGQASLAGFAGMRDEHIRCPPTLRGREDGDLWLPAWTVPCRPTGIDRADAAGPPVWGCESTADKASAIGRAHASPWQARSVARPIACPPRSEEADLYRQVGAVMRSCRASLH